MSYKAKLSNLRAYQAIMLTGSITAAADRLHATQPAISKQLSALEDAIGIRLFDRSSGARMVPTALGLKFFRQIEGTLSGIEDIPQIARDLLQRGQARLRLGATPPLLNSALLGSALQQFFKLKPEVQLTVESRPRQDIEEWVASGQIDVGLALLAAESPFVETTPLIETFAVAVLHRKHRLAKAASLNPQLVANERLALPSRQLLRVLIDQRVESVGQQLAAAVESSSALTCCSFAANSLCIAICDPFSPTAFGGDALVVKPWEPAVPLTYGVLTPKGRDLRPEAATLIRLLQGLVK